MIDFVYLLYNKYSNLMFKINNKTLNLPLCNISFLVVD